MTYVFLESPVALIILLLAAGLVLLFVLQRVAMPRWVLPVYLILAGGLLTVQYFVVTDAEAIRALTRDLARAVDAGDLDTIRRSLHDEFDYRGLKRDDSLELVNQQLQTYGVDEARVGGFEMVIEGERARVEFTARARIHIDELGIQPYLGRWRLDLRREDRTWKLAGAIELSGPAASTRTPPAW